jgi:hypothetical protein
LSFRVLNRRDAARVAAHVSEVLDRAGAPETLPARHRVMALLD